MRAVIIAALLLLFSASSVRAETCEDMVQQCPEAVLRLNRLIESYNFLVTLTGTIRPDILRDFDPSKPVGELNRVGLETDAECEAEERAAPMDGCPRVAEEFAIVRAKAVKFANHLGSYPVRFPSVEVDLASFATRAPAA
jgi:hypothetical protein